MLPRTSLPLGALGAVALLLVPTGGLATPLIDVIFTGSTGAGTPGGSSIRAAPGDVLTAEIRVAAGSEGVSSYGLSLRFDEDLGDELDLEGPASEFLPEGYDFNLTEGVDSSRESTSSVAGYVRTFEAATFAEGPASEAFAVGTVDFLVNDGVEADGTDLRVGLFNPGVDGLFDNAGNDLGPSSTFGTASVNPVPEPTTGALLALGVGALGLAQGRRHGA